MARLIMIQPILPNLSYLVLSDILYDISDRGICALCQTNCEERKERDCFAEGCLYRTNPADKDMMNTEA